MKQIHKRAALAALISATVFMSGCATIESGSTQQIKVSSNPPGATVYTATKKVTKDGAAQISDKVAAGVTPITVTISRKDGAIFLEKEGFEPTEVSLAKKTNPWFWGDVAWLSLLSTSIDTSTGAINQYDPGEYSVDLKPLPNK